MFGFYNVDCLESIIYRLLNIKFAGCIKIIVKDCRYIDSLVAESHHKNVFFYNQAVTLDLCYKLTIFISKQHLKNIEFLFKNQNINIPSPI